MDIVTIIYIVVAIILGAVATYFVMRRPVSTPKPQPQESQTPMVELSRLEQAENLLTEAKARNEELNQQINLLKESGQADPNLLEKLSDIDNLKKRLKKLQDDLDDNEDELDETKKKLKNKVADYNQLQQDKEKVDNDFRKVTRQFEEIQHQLEETTESLHLKMESLTFVQSILTAVEDNDKQTSETYSKVEQLATFIRSDLKDILKPYVRQNGNNAALFGEELMRWEIVQKKSWIAGKTTIAFVGEFSAGKTSIVNRILSQDNPDVPRLPVSTKATTAIPTYITGKPHEEYRFFSRDNKLKKIDKSDFNRVTKEVLDQVGGVSNLIQYFVMAYKNENLDNLSILDTPGFSSNDSEDSQRTLEVINECDALFWVFDVNMGTPNKTSIDLIKKHLHKPLYVVINKVDTKAPSEVESVEKLICDTFQREGVAIEGCIQFSAKAPLNNIMDPIKSVKSTSGESAYLRSLQELVVQVKKDAEKKVKEENKEYTDYSSQFDEALQQFNDSCNTLQENCDVAVNIIDMSWTEQTISKLWGNEDKYELSKEDGENLKETIVDYIAGNNVQVIRNNCELISNLSQQTQQAYSKLIDAREQLQSLTKAEQTLQKNIQLVKSK